jgi:hypothetical protein
MLVYTCQRKNVFFSIFWWKGGKGRDERIYTALGMEFNKPGFGFVANVPGSQAQGIEAVSFCPFWGVGQKIQGTSGST